MKTADVRYSDHHLSRALFCPEHAWKILSSMFLMSPIFGILLSGCFGPSINRFAVSPQVLCEGQTAVARWDVNGEPALAFSVEPAPTARGSCAAKGRETFGFDLVAEKHGKEVAKQIEVIQLRDGSSEPVIFPTSRLEGADVVASGDKNRALWTDHVRVETVASCQDRAIRVEHSGKTALLAAKGSPSDALAGTALTGSWELRSSLSPAEQANPRLRPKQLEILATLRCEKETP